MERTPQKHIVKGKELICSFCGHDEFFTRRTLMNTRGASFFNFDWANRDAQNYICAHCGYIFWFVNWK